MRCPIVFWSGIRYPCRRRSDGDASGILIQAVGPKNLLCHAAVFTVLGCALLTADGVKGASSNEGSRESNRASKVVQIEQRKLVLSLAGNRSATFTCSAGRDRKCLAEDAGQAPRNVACAIDATSYGRRTASPCRENLARGEMARRCVAPT